MDIRLSCYLIICSYVHFLIHKNRTFLVYLFSLLLWIFLCRDAERSRNNIQIFMIYEATSRSHHRSKVQRLGIQNRDANLITTGISSECITELYAYILLFLLSCILHIILPVCVLGKSVGTRHDNTIHPYRCLNYPRKQFIKSHSKQMLL